MTLTREKPGVELASKARLRLWLRLLRVTREVEGALREKLRVEHGTTLPRFDVMSALSHNPAGLKMSELSGVLRVSNGNVTGIIERLVEEGHVLRAPVDGDRRAFSVRLTEKGRTIRTIIAELFQRHADGIMSREVLGNIRLSDMNASLRRMERYWTDQIRYIY